ncbi:phosphoglycerate kinase [Candidatus Lariskella endosymbiont of Epinotia ramella]|uniref:phosphoglycerate kinase n=1 Tax=Candidatus Lariskella endosymbiont of Epinotia ramella TaxID=3066224 RepID=UPI0030D0BA29
MKKMAQYICSIENADCNRKTVLVRVDLNISMHEGLACDLSRLLQIKETVLSLIKKEAKVILISHFGRPKQYLSLSEQHSEIPDTISDMSLAKVLPYLSEVLECDVKFASSCIGEIAKKAVNELDFGQVLLLENLRFFHEEEACDLNFAKMLADLADCYVNEAFSCSHRKHASIVGVCRFLPSYSGIAFKKELAFLQNLIDVEQKPSMLIVGGKKVSTKLKVLNSIIPKFERVFIAGGMANTFLKASGFDIKDSFFEPEMLVHAQKILATYDDKIILPSDFVVQTSDNTIEICCLSNIPTGAAIMDIGPQSLIKISHTIEGMEQILWNGPLGIFENPYFDNSTKFIARYIASLTMLGGVISIAGGGDTMAAINSAGVLKSFSYVSTAGGAFLEFLENATLPGILALISKNYSIEDA